MNQNRTNMTNAEQPSYFNTRDSIIPKLPETPITKPVVIKPADIKPSFWSSRALQPIGRPRCNL